jgi:hypothetical protein
MSNYRWKCKECGWKGLGNEIDMVKDPKSDNLWPICPKCREANQFDNLCDEPGCDMIAGCGWPSPNGYRRTCHKHWIKE